MRSARALVVAFLLASAAQVAVAQAPVSYVVSFPEPEHHIMQVQLTLSGLSATPLELHMSRASPGRYAVHEFAKNVFDVQVVDPNGAPLATTHPTPHIWMVAQHPASVRVTYRVFGDRTDGTYLSVDPAHAHINMPAAFMWARGFEDRPVTVRFERPTGTLWQVATQLFPAGDAQTFSAPNLQYLMDSPTELSAYSLRTFTIRDGSRQPTFRLAIHHAGDDAELDGFARDVEKIVREERGVYGEFAPYDTGTYTFIGDYLPWDNGDGMEHRNSTIVTSSSSIRDSRSGLLGTISHEFFHSWNVERIRPKSLEPFNFDEANMSGELWLAEGFTNYYGPLALRRAGLTQVGEFSQTIASAIDAVTFSPGRQVRTAEEMSQMAPFVDAAAAIDRTDFDNTFISYYTWGEAIALGLDLTLRERSGGKVTLDDFMRAMWDRFGKPGGRAAGYVDRPYTIADAKAVLASVSGDSAFAEDFFARYIQGHQVVEYSRLLANAGFVLRPRAPQSGFAGQLRLQDAANGVRIANAVLSGSPAYQAGLDRDDVITAIGGAAVSAAEQVDSAIRAARPGTTLNVTFLHRGMGRPANAAIRVIADPRIEVVPAETAGQTLTPAQRQFRDEWLRSRAGNTF
ncbi:MAG TPA: PDZ domain-containing protein [Vicinamibacterales bacterium]|jgi:predicted metalloprotease with PDZ domain|nr:PDZ domain-containing protein [Vicinamibacterales bacterium]